MSAAVNLSCVTPRSPTIGETELFHRINETKCYRLLAIPVLDYLCRAQYISDRAFRLWMYLYQVAGSHEDLEVILSYKWMGRRLGKSEATVKRAVKELEEAGLVKLTTRYNAQGSQESNRIQVGMPEEELQRIARESPNRQTIRTWKEEEVKENYTERKQPDRILSGLCVTIDNDTAKQTPPENSTPTNQKPKPSLRTLLQTARRQPSDPEAARNLYQQFRASSAQQQCHPEHMQACPQSPRKAEWGSPCKSAPPIKNNKQILVEQNTPASALSFALPHESLHSHSRRRIYKTLAQLGFRAGQLQRIGEEIAFAVTHPLPDSLFARLGIVHSINICLKKAREGQWTTPSHFSSDSIAKGR